MGDLYAETTSVPDTCDPFDCHFLFFPAWLVAFPAKRGRAARIHTDRAFRTGGKRCYNRLRIPADLRVFSERRCAPVYFGVGTCFELYLIRRRERMDFTAGDAPSRKYGLYLPGEK